MTLLLILVSCYVPTLNFICIPLDSNFFTQPLLSVMVFIFLSSHVTSLTWTHTRYRLMNLSPYYRHVKFKLWSKLDNTENHFGRKLNNTLLLPYMTFILINTN